MSLDLTEKEYSPTNTYSEEYHYSETDVNGENIRYFKYVPIEVTDEEYKKILKYELGNSKQNNNVASTLKVIAWIIYIGGFIIGIILAGTLNIYSTFSFAVALIYWAIAFISGTISLGFAEIIQLLEMIKIKTSQIYRS